MKPIKELLKDAAHQLLVTLLDYLCSKKTLTAVLTAIAAKFIDDPVQRAEVVGTGVTLILAIGIMDHGKSAAMINAAAPAATAAVIAATKALNSDAEVGAPPPPPPGI